MPCCRGSSVVEHWSEKPGVVGSIPTRGNFNLIMEHKILIADDDSDMLNLLSEILSAEKYLVIKANDGLEALEKAKKELPSLIMLDIHMPNKNGIQTLKEIKSDPMIKNIPVIMLTVEGSPSDIQHCMIYGANTYITKPAKKEDIIKTVKNQLI